MCSSGVSTRIVITILGVQSAGFALFYGTGKCSYSRGVSTRIVITILGVQSAGFALFYGTGNRKKGKMAYFVEIYKKTDEIKIIFEKSVQ